MEVKRGGRFVKGKTATREGGRSGWLLNATESPRSRFSLLEGFVHEMSARNTIFDSDPPGPHFSYKITLSHSIV